MFKSLYPETKFSFELTTRCTEIAWRKFFKKRSLKCSMENWNKNIDGIRRKDTRCCLPDIHELSYLSEMSHLYLLRRYLLLTTETSPLKSSFGKNSLVWNPICPLFDNYFKTESISVPKFSELNDRSWKFGNAIQLLHESNFVTSSKIDIFPYLLAKTKNRNSRHAIQKKNRNMDEINCREE